MKRPPIRTPKSVWHRNDELPDDPATDDLNDEGMRERPDPESLAKEITGPIIESMRKQIEKIDVSKFKK